MYMEALSVSIFPTLSIKLFSYFSFHFLFILFYLSSSLFLISPPPAPVA